MAGASSEAKNLNISTDKGASAPLFRVAGRDGVKPLKTKRFQSLQKVPRNTDATRDAWNVRFLFTTGLAEMLVAAVSAPACVVLLDQPGAPLRLIAYQSDAPPVAVEVAPLRALAFAAGPLEGARWSVTGELPQQ